MFLTCPEGTQARHPCAPLRGHDCIVTSYASRLRRIDPYPEAVRRCFKSASGLALSNYSATRLIAPA